MQTNSAKNHSWKRSHAGRQVRKPVLHLNHAAKSTARKFFGPLSPCPKTSCGDRPKNKNIFLENGPPAMITWRQKCTCVSLRRAVVSIQSRLHRTTTARDPGPLRGATSITKLATNGLGKNPPEKNAVFPTLQQGYRVVEISKRAKDRENAKKRKREKVFEVMRYLP